MTKAILLGVLTLTLSSCAVLSNDTGCKKIGGINGCASLSEVNQMSETGRLPDQATQETTTSLKPKMSSAYTLAIPQIGQPVRYGDHIQQITIFPFEDKAGNYHEASIVYTVLKSAHWAGHPVAEIQQEDAL